MLYRWINRLPLFLLSAGVLALLLVLLFLPAPDVPHPSLPFADKFAHIVMFGTLAAVLLWDWSRSSGSITLSHYIYVVVAVSALGGVVELLQGALPLGRSCDVADWLADIAGALIVPILLWLPIRSAVELYTCDVRLVGRPDLALLGWMKRIYFGSFPAEERRDWHQLTRMLRSSDCPVSLIVIYSCGKPVGFITLWKLGDISYVEHFATDPAVRGGGLGGRAIRSVVSHSPSPIVLEVEPAETGDEARRRISFYMRNGFIPIPDFDYTQPPYSPGLPEVKLMLMTTHTTIDVASAVSVILRCVYGKMPGNRDSGIPDI